MLKKQKQILSRTNQHTGTEPQRDCQFSCSTKKKKCLFFRCGERHDLRGQFLSRFNAVQQINKFCPTRAKDTFGVSEALTQLEWEPGLPETVRAAWENDFSQ